MRPQASRIAAVDILRGIVMVIMSIDHASETFNAGRIIGDSAMMFKPGDPLPAAQFLTRWLSHLCAPTFVFLAGTALAISTESRLRRGESPRTIDKHIAIRGLLLLVFEVGWMSWLMLEQWGHILFQVLYALGASFLCMTLLRRLGDRALLAFGVVGLLACELIVGLFAMGGLVSTIPVALTFAGGFFFEGRFLIGYPVVPWLSIMCLGWVLGRRLLAWRAEGKDEAREASRALTFAGIVGLALFVVLRAANGYGNMALPRYDGSVVQWLHVSKYPPSITFAGLELGIAWLILALLLRAGSRLPRLLEPLRLIGQTALFFYLLHIHALALVAVLSGTRHKLGLGASYLGALAVVLALYPLCAWYRGYKARHPDGWARWI